MQGKRAIVYIRVSTLAQEDGASLSTQEDAGRRYAAEHGYVVSDVIQDVYTGSKWRERPGLTRMRDLARSGDIEAVICYTIDRLSRNQAHLAIIVEELMDRRVALEFVTETFEDSAVGRFVMSAKAFSAELEREKIIERSTRGRRARVASGKMLAAGRPLYGYQWRDATHAALAIDPVTSVIVRRIFSEAVAGTSLRAIAKGLTDDGIPTPTGRRSFWAPESIRRMLTNPGYSGRAFGWAWRTDGSTKTIAFDPTEAIALPDGTIPALVTIEEQAAAEARLKRNKLEASRNNRRPEAALLRGGYAKCGDCGRSLYVNFKADGRVVYQCMSNARDHTGCQRRMVNASILDAAVWSRVETILTDPRAVAQELERLRKNDPTTADLAAVERSLVDVTRRQTNIARSLADLDDVDAAAPLHSELKTLSERKRQLQEERESILSRRTSWESAQARLDDLWQWCEHVAANLTTLTYQEKRTALEALGINVRLYPASQSPRYEITTNIRLGAAESVPCDNSSPKHVTQGRAEMLVLKWTDVDLLAAD